MGFKSEYRKEKCLPSYIVTEKILIIGFFVCFDDITNTY